MNRTENKIIEEKIIDMLKRDKVSYYELAVVIMNYLNRNNMTAYNFIKKNDLHGPHLYSCLSMLKSSKKTLELLKEGKIGEDKVRLILYNLKDLKKQDEIIGGVIKEDLSSVNALKRIAVVNNPDKAAEYFLNNMDRFHSAFNLYKLRKKDVSKEKRDEVKKKMKKLLRLIKGGV